MTSLWRDVYFCHLMTQTDLDVLFDAKINSLLVINKTIGKSKLRPIELNQQRQKQFIQETLGPKHEKVGMWQKKRELAKTGPTPYKEVKNMSEERMFYRSNNNDLKHH